MSLPNLKSQAAIIVQQKRELAELFGFETRNKYEIKSESGQVLGFAAEQQKGFLGMLARQILGHWRSFKILIFDGNRQCIMSANHPFRFYFYRLDIYGQQNNEYLGSCQRRFHLLHSTFDILDQNQNIIFSVTRPLWRFWKFTVLKNEQTMALIEKKWTGILAETFTDKDSFKVSFLDPNITDLHRWIITISAVFIDLLYFEKKAGN